RFGARDAGRDDRQIRREVQAGDVVHGHPLLAQRSGVPVRVGHAVDAEIPDHHGALFSTAAAAAKAACFAFTSLSLASASACLRVASSSAAFASASIFSASFRMESAARRSAAAASLV